MKWFRVNFVGIFVSYNDWLSEMSAYLICQRVKWKRGVLGTRSFRVMSSIIDEEDSNVSGDYSWYYLLISRSIDEDIDVRRTAKL